MRFLLVVFILSLICAETLWPKPDYIVSGKEKYTLSPSNFTFKQLTGPYTIIEKAIERYRKYIFPVSGQRLSQNEISLLEISVQNPDETLRLGVDEGYTLDVEAPKASIKALTVYGALRALETFSQLVTYIPSTKSYQIVDGPYRISDHPRYPWRGILLDTSRHFYPISAIKNMIDALSWNKMNTFHWHMVDAESFPFVSTSYPLFTKKAAYSPEATYSPSEVADIVEFGRLRGVRVVPEFDMPGHTASWGVAYPELTAKCPTYEHNVNNIPLNPTRPHTFDVISDLLQESVSRFPDSCIHTGGDEVVFDCWKEDPEISKYMQEHGMSGEQLFRYFEEKVQQLVNNKQKRMVVWEEVFHHGSSIAPDTIVQAWRSSKILQDIVKAGHWGLLSAPWYLDRQAPVGEQKVRYAWVDTWKDFYEADPEETNEEVFDPETNQTVVIKRIPKVPPPNANLILGGEACMWSEAVDESCVEERVWPRACAVAERLWSPQSVRDIDAAVPRLNAQACRMKHRGIHAGPVSPGNYCPQY